MEAGVSDRERDEAARRPASSLPRTLILDVSRPGGESATGQLSKSLFSDWPDGKLLRVYWDASWPWRVRMDGRNRLLRMDELDRLCQAFDPEVIYARPVHHPLSFFQMALYLIRKLDKPYVIHIMDDWLARLEWWDTELSGMLEGELKRLFANASECLSISDAMSVAFSARFGTPFRAVSNGVDLEEYGISEYRHFVSDWSPENPFTIRYCGGLDEGMNRSVVLQFAKMISDLSGEYPVKLEIYTKNHYMRFVAKELLGLPGVDLMESVPDEVYPGLLRDSDLLLIAYSFEQMSVDYTRYSFANKLPECLASRTPVIAIGPRECATIRFLEDHRCASVITEFDLKRIRAEVIRLVEDAPYRARLSETGARIVERDFFKQRMVDRLVDSLATAASQGRPQAGGIESLDRAEMDLAGPFHSDDDAGFDELALAVRLVFEVENENPSRRIIRFNPDAKSDVATAPVDCEWLELDVPLTSSTPDEQMGINPDDVIERLWRLETELPTSILFLESPELNFDVARRLRSTRMRPKAALCRFDDSITEKHGYNAHQLAAAFSREEYRVFVSEWHPKVEPAANPSWNRLREYPCILSNPLGRGMVLALPKTTDAARLAKISEEIVSLPGSRP